MGLHPLLSFATAVVMLSTGLAMAQNAPSMSPAPALTQGPSPEERDIIKALEPMTSSDPIQRVLSTEDALKSEDHLLRSLALEKALGSNDGRVRETGFIYLLDVQKEFLINLDVTKENVGDLFRADDWLRTRTFKLNIKDLNKQTLVFSAGIETGTGCGGGPVSGNVNRTGLIIKMNVCQADCRMQLGGAAGDMLRGTLACGRSSFPISMPLM